METMLLSSAAGWAQLGLRCDVLATASHPGPLDEEMRAAGYGVRHIPFRSSIRYLPSVQLITGFCKLCRNYDVVHLHMEAGTPLFSILARVAGVRHIARSVHNAFRFGGLLRLRKRIGRSLCRKLGVRYGMVSDSVMECEIEQFGNHGIRTWNWLNTEYFRPPTTQERASARAQLSIPIGSLLVVSVGNCNAAKNHCVLLHALEQLRDRLPILYAHVGREDAGRSEFNLSRTLLGLKIRFEGSQPDPRLYLWAADAFLMPSLCEGLGIAALEAVACGTPAVLARVSGLSEILDLTKNTLAAEPTAKSFAAALLSLASKAPEARREDAKEDSARIRRLFSPSRCVCIMAKALYGSAFDGIGNADSAEAIRRQDLLA